MEDSSHPRTSAREKKIVEHYDPIVEDENSRLKTHQIIKEVVGKRSKKRKDVSELVDQEDIDLAAAQESKDSKELKKSLTAGKKKSKKSGEEIEETPKKRSPKKKAGIDKEIVKVVETDVSKEDKENQKPTNTSRKKVKKNGNGTEESKRVADTEQDNQVSDVVKIVEGVAEVVSHEQSVIVT